MSNVVGVTFKKLVHFALKLFFFFSIILGRRRLFYHFGAAPWRRYEVRLDCHLAFLKLFAALYKIVVSLGHFGPFLSVKEKNELLGQFWKKPFYKHVKKIWSLAVSFILANFLLNYRPFFILECLAFFEVVFGAIR